MKPTKLLTLLAIMMLPVVGCTNSVSSFIQSHEKPIIVYHTKDDSIQHHDLTLLSKDGAVLYLDDTSLILPDTIK